MFPTPSSTTSLCRLPIAQQGMLQNCAWGWEIPHCIDAGTLSGAAPWQEGRTSS